MADRKLLELAPGSRWRNEVAIDFNHFHGAKTETVGLVNGWIYHNGFAVARQQDAIALLHRAGLLDGLLAEAWDEGHDAGAAYVRSWGSSLQKNPYRKAGENV